MLLHEIRLKNLLTFGDVTLDLRPLNVLIGANASGKSNLIAAIGLFRGLPAEGWPAGDPRPNWTNMRGYSDLASLTVNGSYDRSLPEFQYSISFTDTRKIKSEVLTSKDGRHTYFERDGDTYRLGEPARKSGATGGKNNSLLRLIRHPDEPQIAALAGAFEAIRSYREFRTGPGTSARQGISASAFGDYLGEDGGNLALVLNEITHKRRESRIIDFLNRFFDAFEGVSVRTREGIVQTYVREAGIETPVPAAALSDGTLRLLCLLAVLLDPTPPPLICIEEPEAGLHPDAIRLVADLIIQASEHMQLIITTHSPMLVDELTDRPESVIVCERDLDWSTHFRRLNASDLDEWLERYSLGQLWQKGEIGGNRW